MGALYTVFIAVCAYLWNGVVLRSACEQILCMGILRDVKLVDTIFSPSVFITMVHRVNNNNNNKKTVWSLHFKLKVLVHLCGLFCIYIRDFLPDRPWFLAKLLVNYSFSCIYKLGAHGGIVVKALCYKLAGRRFNSRCHWNFSVT